MRFTVPPHTLLMQHDPPNAGTISLQTPPIPPQRSGTTVPMYWARNAPLTRVGSSPWAIGGRHLDQELTKVQDIQRIDGIHNCHRQNAARAAVILRRKVLQADSGGICVSAHVRVRVKER